MGYHLARMGLDFVILDAGPGVGASWRARWDSLRLFTPARYSALPGLSFPAEGEHLPSRDEVADYLEHYAHHFGLPIRHDERVTQLTHISEWRGFSIQSTRSRYQADQVVIATGAFQHPAIPSLSHAVAPDVYQIHSSEYRVPEQLPRGNVIVVGGGNSGVQIAAELAQTRPTWLSIGKSLPTLPQRLGGKSVFWWLESLGLMNLSIETRLGRMTSRRDVLIGMSTREAAIAYNVRRAGRAVSADRNVIFTHDGQAIEVAAVVWATGFKPHFSWIDAPVFHHDGRPAQKRGVTAINGLYFLGQPWQHTRGSALLGWVGRDADFLAQRIAA